MSQNNSELNIAALIGQTGNLLSLIETIATVIGIVVAVVAVVLSVSIIANSRKIGSLQREYEKRTDSFEDDIKRQVNSMRSHFNSEVAVIKQTQHLTQVNLTVTAGLVVNSLPQLTFTQQIPNIVFSSVKFLNSDSYHRVLKEENDVGGSEISRVLYAQAIYKLAAYPRTRAELVGDDEVSAAALLKRASEIFDSGSVYFHRDIQLRLSQVYRQADQLANAENCAYELREKSKNLHDQVGEIQATWTVFLVKMQKALTTVVVNERRVLLSEAFNTIEPLFEQLYGWEGRLNNDVPANLQDGSIAYYTAKVLIAYRGTFPKHPEISKLNSVESIDEFTARLQRSLDVALLKYEERRSMEIDDLNIRAIYNLCTAFILLARRTDSFLEEFRLDHHLIAAGNNVRQLLSDNESYKDYIDQCLLSADRAVTAISHRVEDGQEGVLPYIYTESTERIDAISVFQRDLEILQLSVDNPEVFWKFFGSLDFKNEGGGNA